MTKVAASEVRRHLSATLNRVAFGGERIVLHRHGKKLAALVPVEDLALIEEIEDRRDARAARRALADPKNRKAIPWTKARRKLLGK
jgi:prevent-host-death family protein